VLIVLNAEEGVTEQDTKLAGYAYEAGRGCIFVVNKWDAVPNKNNATIGTFVDSIRMAFKYLPFAPILFVSAQSGQRTGQIVAEVEKVMDQFAKRVPTAELNRVLADAIAVHPPPMLGGRRVKLYYGTQVSTKPPTFVVFANRTDAIHFSYERYLANKLREAFGFTGTPLRLLFKGRESRKGA
jgi:GTP-binding protein